MQIRGPESIRTLGLSVSGIQAALRWGHDSNYDTYFFKSGTYWRFSPHENRLESLYPRSMQDWSGIPNDVDAAFRDIYGKLQDPDTGSVDADSVLPTGDHQRCFSCFFRICSLHPWTSVLEVWPSWQELPGGISSLRRHGLLWLQNDLKSHRNSFLFLWRFKMLVLMKQKRRVLFGFEEMRCSPLLDFTHWCSDQLQHLLRKVQLWSPQSLSPLQLQSHLFCTCSHCWAEIWTGGLTLMWTVFPLSLTHRTGTSLVLQSPSHMNTYTCRWLKKYHGIFVHEQL